MTDWEKLIREAARAFIRKVDNGQARSTESYQAFKEALGLIGEEAYRNLDRFGWCPAKDPVDGEPCTYVKGHSGWHCYQSEEVIRKNVMEWGPDYYPPSPWEDVQTTLDLGDVNE